jgi:hypothetical protein
MIRSVTPGDLWVLRRKPRQQVVLYDDSLLAQVHQPLWFALRCFMQGTGRERAMSTFHANGLRAFAQVRGRPGRPEQDILYLASQGIPTQALPSNYDIWYRLLEHLCIQAGHHHIQRLYAAIWSQQVELHEIFRQLGFQSYLRRVVLQLSGPDWDQGTTLAMMRHQSRSDAWAIHKLYGTLAPNLVQQAEVRTARTWTLPLTRRWQHHRRRAWVLGTPDDLEAYLHVRSGPASHVFTMLVRPDLLEQAASIMRFGLAQLHDHKPVYLLLSEYQGELLVPAQNLGFQPIGEQTLLMKSMTVKASKPVLVSAFEPSLEPRITIPHISVPREDSHSYVRPQRDNK